MFNHHINGNKKVGAKATCQTVDAILKEERAYKARGYYSFYHGCMKDIYFTQLIDTKLDELLTGKKTHFLIMRSPIPGNLTYSDTDRTQHTLTNEKEISTHLKEHGVRNDEHDNYRQRLLSVNSAITGCGCCTLSYFVNSFSSYGNKPRLTDEKQKIYNKYQQALDELEREFENLSGGILLHIAINKDCIDEYSYSSAVGGGIKTSLKNGNNNINKTTEIIDSLSGQYTGNTNLHSQLVDTYSQFRLILTKDFLLNPYDAEVAKNIKIKAWSFNQNKLNQLHDKVDELMAKIKKDMQNQ